MSPFFVSFVSFYARGKKVPIWDPVGAATNRIDLCNVHTNLRSTGHVIPGRRRRARSWSKNNNIRNSAPRRPSPAITARSTGVMLLDGERAGGQRLTNVAGRCGGGGIYGLCCYFHWSFAADLLHVHRARVRACARVLYAIVVAHALSSVGGRSHYPVSRRGPPGATSIDETSRHPPLPPWWSLAPDPFFFLSYCCRLVRSQPQPPPPRVRARNRRIIMDARARPGVACANVLCSCACVRVPASAPGSRSSPDERRCTTTSRRATRIPFARTEKTTSNWSKIDALSAAVLLLFITTEVQ